ncbi:MAG TPA: hypothetical protein VL442_09700, partial [Mucilaginibacter sp.]|nr:hypothetical protein [Mucilaginibacter sp.]
MTGLFFFQTLAQAQTPTQVQLPSVIPPSPQSAAFQRYGEIPVNYNTGLPDITIPLYTVRSGNITVPVVLRYYASGIKPYEPDASCIGSGWSLDYGGQVNRTIEGKADELFAKPDLSRPANQINQNNQSDVYYLDAMLQPTSGTDSRYDRFSYSAGDQRGSFAIQDDGSGNFTAYPYPFVPYNINVHTGAPTSSQYYKSITGIDIVNDKGIKYQFGYSNTEISTYGTTSAPTGWYLEKVADAYNKHQISFAYIAGAGVSSGKNENSIVISEGSSPSGDLGSESSPGDNGVSLSGTFNLCDVSFAAVNWQHSLNYSSYSYSTKNISTITFQDGYLKFNWDASNRHLQSIEVYNNKNEKQREIDFNIDNFPNSTVHYRLNSVSFKDMTGTLINSYSFNYDLTNPVADNSCLVDQWGYCRGSAQPNTPAAITMSRTISVTPSENAIGFSPPQNMNVGDQAFTPQDSYTKRFILNKITYPTGGNTQFIYEGNVYHDVTDLTGGGLRIKQVISDDGNGHTNTKSYTYSPGFLEYPLSNILYSTQCGFTITTVPNCYVDAFGNLMYYVFRTRTIVNGWNSDLGANPVYYNTVTEYQGDATTNAGKTVYTYTYDNPNGASVTTLGDGKHGVFMPNYYISVYKNWGNGLLKTKASYKLIGSGTYQKVSDLTNNYTFVNLKTLQGLYVYIVASYQGAGSELIGIDIARSNVATHNINKSDLLPGASVNQQSIVTGAYYLSSTIENQYDQNNNAVTLNTTYEHSNPAHYYPTKIIKDLSTGQKSVRTLSYVNEFAANEPYTSMQNLNIVEPLIEAKNYKRDLLGIDHFTEGVKNDYALFSSISQYLPSQIETGNTENVYEPRIVYQSYDGFSNLQSASKKDGPSISYQWGYNGQYPVAEVKNSSNTNIFYESFEEGNGTTAIGGGKTGHYGFNGSTAAYTHGL